MQGLHFARADVPAAVVPMVTANPGPPPLPAGSSGPGRVLDVLDTTGGSLREGGLTPWFLHLGARGGSLVHPTPAQQEIKKREL